MEKLTMCRICLAENVRMYKVVDENLQKIYEELTDIPFITEDCRPMLACIYCYAKLTQCCQFVIKCLKAEEVFAQLLNGVYKQIPLELKDELNGFIKTPIELISIDAVGQIGSDASIDQLPAVPKSIDDINIKMECAEEEQGTEHLDNIDTLQVVQPQGLEPESDYYVPIINLKTKVEEKEEAPRKNTRARSASKSKLNVQKTKLLNTTTNKRKKNTLSSSKSIRTTQKKKSNSEPKFRVPIISNIVSKPEDNNCLKSEETPNKEYVAEEIKTDRDMNYRNDINNELVVRKTLKGNNNKNEVKAERKCHNCHICQRGFSRKYHMERHMRVHTDEKRYKCDICQSSFSRNKTLKAHILVHTPVSPLFS